jgi:mono/diheme cytochrome c family protein
MAFSKRYLRYALLIITVAACAPPLGLPDGPTPIPTLIPVIEPEGPTEAPTQPSFAIQSYPASPPSAVEGQEIYAAQCATCHGADGTGTMPAARNFRDLDYMRGETPANFYAAVTEGRGEMPTYKDSLSSDERWDVVFFIWRLATSSTVLQSGKVVYDDQCANCHGSNGSGELLGSADFTDLRQMDQLAPRDLYLTVTQGRGSMPSWQARLSQDDRWAVIDYLRTFTYSPSLPDDDAPALPVATPTGTASALPTCPVDAQNPFAWDDADTIQAGQTIYQDQCALCHGADGSGGLPSTPDFTSEEINAELLSDPGRSLCSLQDGIGSMPAFGTSLSEEELWQVLTYLASLWP